MFAKGIQSQDEFAAWLSESEAWHAHVQDAIRRWLLPSYLDWYSSLGPVAPMNVVGSFNDEHNRQRSMLSKRRDRIEEIMRELRQSVPIESRVLRDGRTSSLTAPPPTRTTTAMLEAATQFVGERVPKAERPQAEVSLMLRDLAVFLRVKNIGSGATFYATFRTDDHRRSASDYVRWAHTSAIKTVIPSGVVFEAKLAEFKLDATKRWWRYFVTRESGTADVDSHYSVPTAIPPQIARPVVLSGQVMSEPDIFGGPVPYEYVLSPLGPKNYEGS